jgi:hypothetical protein
VRLPVRPIRKEIRRVLGFFGEEVQRSASAQLAFIGLYFPGMTNFVLLRNNFGIKN